MIIYKNGKNSGFSAFQTYFEAWPFTFSTGSSSRALLRNSHQLALHATISLLLIFWWPHNNISGFRLMASYSIIFDGEIGTHWGQQVLQCLMMGLAD